MSRERLQFVRELARRDRGGRIRADLARQRLTPAMRADIDEHDVVRPRLTGGAADQRRDRGVIGDRIRPRRRGDVARDHRHDAVLARGLQLAGQFDDIVLGPRFGI
jgi:hypothetical protein